MEENKRLLGTANLDEEGSCLSNAAERQNQRHRSARHKEYVRRTYFVFLHAVILVLSILLARPLLPFFAVDGITFRKSTFLLIWVADTLTSLSSNNFYDV
jgi:hypothetical protein